jgi:hypothetical protein
MFGANDLKPQIQVGDTRVECPVSGCLETVQRQRTSFKREPSFQRQKHKIYISPSTFEYANEADNLLWTNSDDLALLQSIKLAKRESRKAREKSEDAVTWNVFRFLEKTAELPRFLSTLAGLTITNPEVIYWSYCPTNMKCWPYLSQARIEFGETPQRGSEPDVIIVANEALFWIEAKFTSTNRTHPSDPSNEKRYLTGGNQWAKEVFQTANFQNIAVQQEKYELFRLWLLGTWAANQSQWRFYLVNLVSSNKEKNIEAAFRPHLKCNSERTFVRSTWEDIYRHILRHSSESKWKQQILSYYQGKTVGYDRWGKLQLAFDVSR